MPYSGPCDWAVCGGQAAGATNSQNPVVLAGTTSGNVIRTLRVDDDGALTTAPGATPQMVEGVVADGGTLTGTNPVLIAGQDGSVAQSLLTDTSGRPQIVGAAADGAAVAGNPLLLGISDATNARYALSVSGAVNTNGTAILGNGPLLYDGTNWQPWRSAYADGLTRLGAAMVNAAGYNGASMDAWRSNTEATLLTSAARTATTNTTDQTNYNARGVILSLDVTANPGGAETLSLDIQYKDPAGGVYASLYPVTLAVQAANGTFQAVCYPGASENLPLAALEIQGLPLPRTWRARVVHSAAGSWTYSLSLLYIL